jgi:hypothetical protein
MHLYVVINEDHISMFVVVDDDSDARKRPVNKTIHNQWIAGSLTRTTATTSDASHARMCLSHTESPILLNQL